MALAVDTGVRLQARAALSGRRTECERVQSQVELRRLRSTARSFVSSRKGRHQRLVLVRAESEDDKDKRKVAVEEKQTEASETNGDFASLKEYAKEMSTDLRALKSNPTIENAIKVAKRSTEQRLRQLDQEAAESGFLKGLLARAVRFSVQREAERLARAEEMYKALDLSKLKSCFNFDTFYATDVRRFGDGGIFVGNLRRPLSEVKPLLEQRLTEAAGIEVNVWFMTEAGPDGPRQVCVVQPKSEIEMQFARDNTPLGYITAISLAVTSLGTVAVMSSFFLAPNATFDDFVSRFLPLFGGFITIFATSEVATRLVARVYGVKLSPTYLVPSTWTGCLGAINDFESLLPNKRALFDIPAARTTSAYLTSLLLAVVAFYLDKDLAGGENALYIRPQFFINNPLLSFVQYVIGPYNDELGNILPQAVEGLGVPLDPLAFAGLLGMVVTALNLLPAGRLEGGRIAQAMVGRARAAFLSRGTTITLGLFGIGGSVLGLLWAFVAGLWRRGEELPAQDEITELGTVRIIWGVALAVFCVLTLFPGSAGTFPSVFYTPPFWRGGDF